MSSLNPFLLCALAVSAVSCQMRERSLHTLTMPQSLEDVPAVPGVPAEYAKAWQRPDVNAVNRLPMHIHALSEQAPRLSLDGTWDFCFLPDSRHLLSDFYSPNYHLGREWTTIPVPANWGLQGFGDPIYVNMGYMWRGRAENNPPFVPIEENQQGYYRRYIKIPEEWRDQQVVAHFGSVPGCFYLWVNGHFVGYSEDSKLEAEFDITPYITVGGRNLIALQEMRWCDGSYLEDQDYFRHFGLSRSSWLYARSKMSYIEDLRLTATLCHDYRDGLLQVQPKIQGTGQFSFSLYDADGKAVAVSPEGYVLSVHPWSAEDPYRYTLVATLTAGRDTVQTLRQKIGFRSVEVKTMAGRTFQNLLINGKPVLIKGVDRHELDPETGYVVSHERMRQDAYTMKRLHVNAVRTSHYPNDAYWYDLCDSLGFYVVGEANVESHGMGYGDRSLAKNDTYQQAHLERNARNIARNFNHPSVVIWSLGNEAGYGANFEAAYDYVKQADPSRPVQYEQASIGGKTDIFCPMYFNYDDCVRYCQNDSGNRWHEVNVPFVKPLIQCEYAHAMGNSEGGFAEYWQLIRQYPKYQGGFIWDFVDQSLRGEGGRWLYGGDWNSYDASDGNFCDNGLVAPDRSFNPHAYEVQYYYQDLWTRLDTTQVDLLTCSQLHLRLFNERFFTTTTGVRLQYELLAGGQCAERGEVAAPVVAPQDTADLFLPLKTPRSSWVEYYLSLAYVEAATGDTLARQQFALHTPANPSLPELTAETGKVQVQFDEGWLSCYQVGEVSYLKPNERLAANFWRAPTDNDYGARIQQKSRLWRDPQLPLVKFTDEQQGDHRVVCSEYLLPDSTDGRLSLCYDIAPSGVLTITERLTADTSRRDIPDLLRFGLRLPMPKTFETLAYYGRGPVENYPDRKDSQFVGFYRTTVTDAFYPYIRPQENGNHEDLRYLILTNADGHSLMVSSPTHFSGSALHYTPFSLDEGWEKHNLHSPDIQPQDVTSLLLDSRQAGLGCVNSWGALPLPSYRMPYQDYVFTVTLRPCLNDVL